MLRRNSLCCTVLHCALLCFIVLRHASLCFVVLHCASLCFTVSHCAALCFTVLRRNSLCLTVLHCASLCCIVLCCALLGFTVAHTALQVRDFGTSAALLLCLFQGAAWSNVLVMSLYYTAESTTTLDWLMVVFASCPWIDQMHLWWLGFGTDGGTIACLCVSLFGIFAMLVDNSDLLHSSVVPMNTARFLTGFSTVTIFTKNTRFAQLMTTASTVCMCFVCFAMSHCALL